MKVIKKLIKKFVFAFIKPEIKIIYSSYSQAGEDVIINMLFNSVNIKNPGYLDAGVCHPELNDNTYFFYKKGSRGVCVEANPSLIENIREVRQGDIVLNVGLGEISGTEADFYTFADPNLNTFDKEEAEKRDRLESLKIIDILKVPMQTINEIIGQNFNTYPDFISLDIEGLDLNVLKTLDYKKFPVPVICVETCSYSKSHIKPKILEFNTVMEEFNYFVYADTYINTIYVNKTWFENVNRDADLTRLQ